MNLEHAHRHPKIFKRSVLLIVLLLILVLTGASATALDEPEWQIQTVDVGEEPSNDVGMYSSIALDAQGIPHISYYDVGKGDLKFASREVLGGDAEAGWVVQTVDSIGDVGKYSSLAIDSKGLAHVSYYDDSIYNLKYARQLSETDWLTETVDFDGDVGKYSSLALDGTDHPHISYYDGYDNNDLKYAFLVDTEWISMTVDSGDDVGLFTSLKLDSSGLPHISYLDKTNRALNYAYTTSTSIPFIWMLQSLEMGEDQFPSGNTSLALDRNDAPHIASIQQIGLDPPTFKLNYNYWDESWYSETVTTWVAYNGQVSLALDRSDRPHIAFYDGEVQHLKYATRDYNGWHIETVDQEGDVGSYPAIALNRLGVPHISYRDNTLDKYDLKYATLPYVLQQAFISLVSHEWVHYFTWYHEIEDNDSISQANGALVFGQQYIGYHNDEDDYFSIFTSKSTTLSIELDTDHLQQDASGYYVVQLVLYYGSAAPERVGWVYSPPYQIEYEAPAGWYYVRVYTAPGYLDGSKEYRLTVTSP